MDAAKKTGARTAATLLVALALVCLAVAPSALAATREPMSVAMAALHDPEAALEAAARPNPRALHALLARSRARASDVGGDSVQISSTYYGPEQEAEIAAVLSRLDHGPEMAQLKVYVATPAEIAETCGAAVIACYMPSEMEMVVSGVNQPVDGVPRDFAIAHEYGHHIATTQRGDLYPAIEAGTIRWATYERVCQFTRSHRLFPGNQGSHYWQDPEEAFAEAYAHLSDPESSVSWQYSPLLAPTASSLAKIQADLENPWSGPVTEKIAGSVSEPATGAAVSRVTGSAGTALEGAVAVGRPGVFSRLVATPLDGQVSVTLQAPPGADLAVSLRDPGDGRVFASGSTGEGGSARISYASCGHDSLQLEVRSLHGGGAFEAAIVKP